MASQVQLLYLLVGAALATPDKLLLLRLAYVTSSEHDLISLISLISLRVYFSAVNTVNTKLEV
jgi:hypothetical protein